MSTSTSNSMALYGGTVITLDAKSTTTQAVLISEGRVSFAGSDAAVLAAAPKGAAKINLEGRTAIPGMTDSHMHLHSYGFAVQRLRLNDCPSIAEMKRLVAEKAAQVPAGEWILGRGWDQDFFAEKRFATRDDLDLVAPRHPVLLTRCCGHASVANSLALQMAGITDATADPPGGHIQRDASGRATGVLIDRAAALVNGKIPEPNYEQKKRALGLAIERALAAGLVAVHPDDIRTSGSFETSSRLYHELAADGRAIRVYQDVSDFALTELRQGGLVTGDGDDLYKVGATKLFADGSLGALSAALREPYLGTHDNRGLTIHDQETFTQMVTEAHAAGMQVAIHAIGDRAMDNSLDAIEAALAKYPRPNHRHRIVHCQIMSEDLIARFARVGVVADIQPRFLQTDMRWAEERVGADRCRTSYAWKSLAAAGVPTAGGSDAPVEPLEPLLGIYAAVTREKVDGGPAGGWFPAEKLTAEEALRLFCLGGAYAAFEEGRRGSLETGKLGDVVVLSGNPLACDPYAIKDLKVELTVLGGRIAYSAGTVAPRA